MNTTKTPEQRITANVKTLMHIRGYEHHKDLGARLGWSESKISRALNKHAWQLHQLDKLADALRVEASDLLKDPETYLPGGDARRGLGGSVTVEKFPGTSRLLGKKKSRSTPVSVKLSTRCNDSSTAA